MRNRLIATLAAAAAGVALGAGPTSASPKHDQDPPIRTEWMPCAMEDAEPEFNCVWDAQHAGNGLGNSFFAGREGRIWVLPHHIAHYLINGNNARGEYFACTVPVGPDPTSCIWEETVWLGASGNDTEIPHSVARYLLSR